MDLFLKKNRYFNSPYKYDFVFDRYFEEWDTAKETKNDLHTIYNRRLLRIRGSLALKCVSVQ